MLAFVAALACSVVLRVLLPVLRRAQFMDVPNHRSSHTRRCRAAAGWPSCCRSSFVALVVADTTVRWRRCRVRRLLLAAGGLVDDLRSLAQRGASLGQVVVASLSRLALLQRTTSWWWLPGARRGHRRATSTPSTSWTASTASPASRPSSWALVGLGWSLLGSRRCLPWVWCSAGASLGFLPVERAAAQGVPRRRGQLRHWSLRRCAQCSGVGTGASLALAACSARRVRGRHRVGATQAYSVPVRPLTEAHREHVYQRLVDGGWSHLRRCGVVCWRWCCRVHCGRR